MKRYKSTTYISNYCSNYYDCINSDLFNTVAYETVVNRAGKNVVVDGTFKYTESQPQDLFKVLNTYTRLARWSRNYSIFIYCGKTFQFNC